VALPSAIELGPYQLHERIGEGGNGQVHRATGPDGPVAIKLMGPATDVDEAALARFRREIAALGELSHPNLIPLVDHGFDAELGPYLVLPLLAGSNLRALCRGRALCPEAAILLLEPVVQATAALHAAGFVHRDLKPENAIATPDGTITVVDLGLAWGEGMSRHTESGAAVGSIGYMSPEQLDGRSVEAPADVWALGVMLYECIAGKRPFARGRPTEEVAATLLGTFAPLTAADRRVDEALGELVARCLATDPAKRPTAAALATALGEMIDWMADETVERTTECAAVVADPLAYQARVAPFRVRRVEREAREALAEGKPFAALTHCDRGLAYLPEHPPLVALIAEAEAATAEKPEGPVAYAISAVRTRKGKIAVGAIAAIVVALIVIVIVIPDRAPAPKRIANDPWDTPVVPLSPTERAADRKVDEQKLDTMKSMVGLLGRAMDMVEKKEAGTAPPPTATAEVRCLELVRAKNVAAVEPCTEALTRSPDDVAFRAARAVALVLAKRPAEAIADFDKVVASGQAAEWRRMRGEAKAAAGDAAGAQQDLAEACRLGDAAACQPKR
jgi:serine/threonine-protein kinase